MKKILLIISILLTSLFLTSCGNNNEEQKIIDDLDLEIQEFLEKNPESDLDKIGNEKDESEKIEKTSTGKISEKVKIIEKNDKEEINIEITKTLEEFAKCITKNGAKVYGTSWCGHCKKQKEMFGDAVKNINFIDCDINRKLCKDKGITGYPTWKINGESFPGVQSFELLGEKTGCKLVK